eukprot:jgi/Astpho2/7416/Aster-x1432
MSRQPRSKGKSGDPGGGLGIFMAVAGAMVAACVGAMFRDHRKQAADTSMLHKMLRKPINYTEHAKCRMDCRYISDAEVRESLKTGKVNSRKSNREALPCPKITVDAAVGPNGKHIQNVFNACPGSTDVITVIDTDTNWACYCP